jgi:hypothetical protein
MRASFYHCPLDVRASELSISHVQGNWQDKSLDNRKHYAEGERERAEKTDEQ